MIEKLTAAAVISSLFLTWWFMTNLPVRVTKLARWLGWNKHDTDFWPSRLDYKFWLRHEWEEWLVDHRWISPLLREGLVCPWCLSLHFSWISGIIVALWNGMPVVTAVRFVMEAALLCPVPALMLFLLLKLIHRKSQTPP